MALGAEEALQESSSASPSRGQWEAAAAGLCPICLDDVDDAAHVDTCLHTFCFGCIRQWAAVCAACPLCRQRFGSILHAVRADDDYQEYVVGAAAQRARGTAPRWRYQLRPRPHGDATAGSRGPVARRRGRPPRTSNTSAR